MYICRVKLHLSTPIILVISNQTLQISISHVTAPLCNYPLNCVGRDFSCSLSSPSQVTLIPTHDSEVTRDWYQQTHEKQQELNIMVLASSSTVVMQDESFPACKIEF